MTEPVGQVLIRAGVPGKPDLTVAHGKPYPNTTTDMAKLLAERGLTVTYEDEKDQRSYVSFYAVELWIPICEIATSILAGMAGNFFSDVIRELLGTERPAKAAPAALLARRQRPGSAVERPARRTPGRKPTEPQIKMAHTSRNPVQRSRLPRPKLSSSRPPRQWRPCGRSHAIGYADH